MNQKQISIIAIGLSIFISGCANKPADTNTKVNVDKYLNAQKVFARYSPPMECEDEYRKQTHSVAILPVDLSPSETKVTVFGNISKEGYKKIDSYMDKELGLADKIRTSLYRELAARYPFVVYADGYEDSLRKNVSVAIKPEVRGVKIEEFKTPEGNYFEVQVEVFYKLVEPKTGLVKNTFVSIGKVKTKKFVFDTAVNWDSVFERAIRDGISKAVRSVEVFLPRTAKALEVRENGNDRYALILGKGISKGAIYVPVVFEVKDLSGIRMCIPKVLDAKIKVETPLSGTEGWAKVEGDDKSEVVEGVLLRYLP